MKKLGLIIALTASVALTGCAAGGNGGEYNPLDYVELGEYKGLEVIRPTHEVTQEEIDDEMNLLLSSKAEVEEVTEGSVVEGDTVNIDYEGKKDGVAFDGGTAKGYDLTIGSHAFIDGFEDGLVGVNVGDTVDLNLTFPEQYQAADLAGQDVVFTVKVNSIKRTHLPELTDDFIKEVSEGEFSTIADYTESLKEQIKSEYTEYLDTQMYEDLWNKVLANTTVKKDFPQDVLQDKISKMVLNAQQYAKTYNMEFEDFIQQYMGLTKEQFNQKASDYASTAAKESMVLKAIADAEGIVLSEEEVNEAVDKYVEMYAYNSAEEFIEDNDMDQFREYILTSKVQQFLADNAVITEGTEEEAQAQRAANEEETQESSDSDTSQDEKGGLSEYLKNNK